MACSLRAESVGSNVAERVMARCRELAGISDVAGETTRLFLSPATRRVHEVLGGWMRAAGMRVRTDACGNLRGVLAGCETDGQRVLMGSHIDTVPNAGAFDGVLGVLLGVAMVEELAGRMPLPFSVEVLAFSEEEGVRFGRPFLGSLALIGELDGAALAVTDGEGVSMAEAIRGFGLDPAALGAAVVDGGAAAYLEFHIEQGPVLDAEGIALGVVEAIAGQSRWKLIFTGEANHAGTTPMGSLRRDALAAAAEWVVEVERYADATPGLVATVGRLDGRAGAGNVIAGEVMATLDVRHARDEVREAAVGHLLAFAVSSGARRGVRVSHAASLEQGAVAMDPRLSEALAEAVLRGTGSAARRMTSGAGHDAMIVARRIPSAMLFLRSPGGLSHHPAESVLAGDVEAALATGLAFLEGLREGGMPGGAAFGRGQRGGAGDA